MFDLKKLSTKERANEGFDVVIVDPNNDEPTDLVITVLGEDSDPYIEWQRRQAVKSARTAMRARTDAERAERLVDGAKDDMPKMLAACTVGWKNMEEDGKPLPFTKANAERVYAEYPVIRDQVRDAQRDRANFLPR